MWWVIIGMCMCVLEHGYFGLISSCWTTYRALFLTYVLCSDARHILSRFTSESELHRLERERTPLGPGRRGEQRQARVSCERPYKLRDWIHSLYTVTQPDVILSTASASQ